MRLYTSSLAVAGALVAGSCRWRSTDPTPAVATTHRAVTYAKDVAPILQQKCQECHQPNSIAPMSLLTYDDAVDNADAIKDKVANRLMPPWHIDKTVGIQQVQERSQPHRRADRDDRELGRRRHAARQSVGHAAAARSSPIPTAGSSPTSSAHRPISSSARRRTRLPRTRRTSGSVRRSRPGSPSRAGCARSRSSRCVRATARSSTTCSRICMQDEPEVTGLASTRARSPEQRRPVHGMGGRQDGADLRDGRRQADAPRLEDPLGDPHARDRPGVQGQPGRAGDLLLSEGLRAEASHGAARCSTWRADSELDIPPNEKTDDAELLRPAGAGAPREFPAAHAHARHGDVARGDLSRTAARKC